MNDEDKKKPAPLKPLPKLNKNGPTDFKGKGLDSSYDRSTRNQSIANYNQQKDAPSRTMKRRDFARDLRNYDPAYASPERTASVNQRAEQLGISQARLRAFLDADPKERTPMTAVQRMRQEIAGGDNAGNNVAANAGQQQQAAFGFGKRLGGRGMAGRPETSGIGGASGLTSGNERNEMYSPAAQYAANAERKLSRDYNMAYRQAIRQGDRKGALNIRLNATQNGISFGGIKGRFDLEQKAQGQMNPNAAGQARPNVKPDAMFGNNANNNVNQLPEDEEDEQVARGILDVSGNDRYTYYSPSSLGSGNYSSLS